MKLLKFLILAICPLSTKTLLKLALNSHNRPSFPHQNVTKYIKVSCYVSNMNIMQYFGKFSPCTRCTCEIKFNLSDTHFSWKGYLIGRLPPKINIHLIAYKKKQAVRRCLLSKNPTFTFKPLRKLNWLCTHNGNDQITIYNDYR
jgi:hypothetical protein